MTVNEQHVHAKLGGRTAAQYRRDKQLRKLPADFAVGSKLPIAVGKVTFIRLVAAQSTVRKTVPKVSGIPLSARL
jgi:hypothetical protein